MADHYYGHVAEFDLVSDADFLTDTWKGINLNKDDILDAFYYSTKEPFNFLMVDKRGEGLKRLRKNFTDFIKKKCLMSNSALYKKIQRFCLKKDLNIKQIVLRRELIKIKCCQSWPIWSG